MELKDKYETFKKNNTGKFIIYIKTAKTAGRQTRFLLEKYFPDKFFIIHPKLFKETYKKNKNIFNDSYIITTIRNPYYRYLSGCSYLKIDPKEYITKINTKLKDKIYKHIAIKQYENIIDDNINITNYFIRQESYYKDIIKIFNYFNVNLDKEDKKFLKNYKDNNKEYDLILKDNKIKNDIYNIFKNDFIKLNYSK